MMAPPGGGALGARVQFTGDGGSLLVSFLIYGLGPAFAAGAVYFVVGLLGSVLARLSRAPMLAVPFVAVGALAAMAIGVVGGILLANKLLEFRYDNTTIDGQRCKYVGTAGGLFKVAIVPYILIALTFGIYTPWAIVKIVTWTFENVEVNGQRGRLTFHGDGGTLLGKYILGMLLTMCTFYIYGAWFANDLFAFFWENTKLDGRGFAFRKDPGGFLGTYIINVLLSMITCNIYQPWALCNIWRWECERVA